MTRKRSELKIFRKVSIGYLKRMYRRSVAYVQDQNLWRSAAPETFGEVRLLLHTRKSIKRLGGELKIFKFPTIDGVRIVYHKSIGFVFDKYQASQRLALNAEGDYLLRDLPASTKNSDENEMAIFRLPNIEQLKSLYYNRVGK